MPNRKHKARPWKPRCKKQAVVGRPLCPGGKVPDSKSGAQRALKKYLVTHGANDPRVERVMVYECRMVPGVWHIGHSAWALRPGG